MAEQNISIRAAGAKLLQLISLERKEVSRIYLFATLGGLIQLSLPLGIQAIIGLLFGGIITASLVVLISFVVGGVLLAGVFQIFQMRVTESIQQRIFARLTFAYANRIPKIDLLSVDSYYLPELVNRFFDTASLQKGLSKLLLDFPAATIQIVFGLTLLSFYHPIFIAFGLILILIVYLLFYFSSGRGFKTSLQESDYKYEVAHWLEEISRTIKTFKFSHSELHLRRTDKLTAGYLDARTAHFKILLMQYKVLIAFKVLITASMLIMGAFLLTQQQINLGQFVAAEIIIIVILNSVEKLIVSLETVYDILTSIEKLDKVLQKPHEQERELEQGLDSILGKPLNVAVRNLRFAYPGSNPIFDNLSFDIAPGEKVRVAGKQGVGKTTLLRILAGLYPEFTGSIIVNGIPLKNIPVEHWRKRVAVFFAQEELFGGTLIDNLTIGNADISLPQIVEVCELVGLREFVESHKDGYQVQLDPMGQRLSNSIVSKILMARCFLNRPSLLILENGWQSIEPEYRTKIINKLIDDKSFSLLVVTENEELCSKCDKVISLN
ncbi:peptidase domain-containing ABC transporter [Desertivirga arenae]|uniref:peptidase domain-containing ABC transporter n=1 Tax=Desertivirga arenae TaxID=2810309 RepID=UPI001A95C83A|nr:ABC transporter ATP-binding protein [Pedobacter sp. SYSU D00823]